MTPAVFHNESSLIQLREVPERRRAPKVDSQGKDVHAERGRAHYRFRAIRHLRSRLKHKVRTVRGNES